MRSRAGAILILASVFIGGSGCDYKPRNQGKSLYNANCLSCHMDNGEGLEALFPPLANADYVLENADQLACIIRYGVKGELTVNGVKYDGEMAGNQQLSETEVSNIVHYIMVDLNHQESHPGITEIRAQLENCKED
ncbi:MAG: cytochrome c [Flavobacteriales bacterium]|nr:cytochrome c [Flavobacteriales bacterium]